MTYKNGHNTIVQNFVERQPNITGAVLKGGRRRAAEAAQAMSRHGAMAAAAELCNTAMSRLIELAYEQDETGLVNVDNATGVFERFPMPWGRYYQRYGLRATESAVLALHVKRLQELRKVPPLFTYDEISKRWAVNIFDYPNRESAFSYWKRAQLDAKTYRALLQTVQNRRKSGA